MWKGSAKSVSRRGCRILLCKFAKEYPFFCKKGLFFCEDNGILTLIGTDCGLFGIVIGVPLQNMGGL